MRRVYQFLCFEIADTFYKYTHSFDPDELRQADDGIKTNGWGVINLLEIENSSELLSTFQLFY